MRLIGALLIPTITSCTLISETGPNKHRIHRGSPAYDVVQVKSKADLPAAGRRYGQAESPPRIAGEGYTDHVRERDSLTFVFTDLSEQSPFSGTGDAFNYGPIEVPEDGLIQIPYVGEINVINRSLFEISKSLSEKIKPVSNTAEVTALRTQRFLLTANVMGEVNNPGPVILERRGLTSHDLLAASGGPARAEHLFSYTLRRGGRDYHFDYQGFRKKPFIIEAGDLLTVMPDATNRFQVMGAINRPTSVAFPVPDPTLADALGAATGLDERRSDPSGVFVFRKGNPDCVYTFNLKDPAVMSLVQRFPMQGEDIVYITEAPLTRWNRMISQILPSAGFQAANAAALYGN